MSNNARIGSMVLCAVAMLIAGPIAGFAQAQFEDDQLGSIHIPTLVVWGREDELISVTRAEKFRHGIPGAKLVVFEQCGHVPQLEKPDDFNQAVLDFLGR